MIFLAIVEVQIRFKWKVFIKSVMMSNPIPSVPLVIPDQDWNTARVHAPVVFFDRLEPFLPVAVGYTVFTENGSSASFKRTIEFPQDCTTVIEYAIWWDWDIQHLYELEHLWIYLDELGNIIEAEGSFHGDFHSLKDPEGKLFLEEHRLVAFSEPGKHAFYGNQGQIQHLEPLHNNFLYG